MMRDALDHEVLRRISEEGTDDERAESPEDVEKAWAEEIERRARRILAGESTGKPWDEIRRRLEA